MLWTDEQVAFEIGNLTKGRPAGEVAELIERVRGEYESRIAELEKERDEYKDVAAANAAINRQCKERIESDAARIAELESKLAACIELDEAKLRQVDSQAERIAELEAALIAAKTQLAASEMWK